MSIKKTKNNGFTIIELLMAMAVFSLTLMVFTIGIIKITQSYYRGINQANTQTAARNIINSIAQSIQFAGSQPGPTGGTTTGTNLQSPNNQIQGECVGNQMYSYYLYGEQVAINPNTSNTPEQIFHTLVASPSPSC